VEIDLEYPLTDSTLRSVDAAVATAQVIVLGTLNAVLDPNQIRLAERVRDRAPDARLVVVALRGPYDLLRLPWLDTYVCAYTSVEPVMVALAEVLFGAIDASGGLPVDLADQPSIFRRP
jgi:beta-N-acetylhexosaminidase